MSKKARAKATLEPTGHRYRGVKQPPIDVQRQALAERQRLLKSCYGLLIQISYKNAYLKMLRAAEEGLKMIAGYKANRGQ
jgi:hypothetical protein